MKDDAIILSPEIGIPDIPENWNYDQSVKRVGGLIYKWKNMTAEILSELWIAREVLSSPGQRTDLTSLQMQQGWSGYCQAISLDRTTAHRWLAKAFPRPELESHETPSLPTGKNNVLYADPPWQYQNSGFDEAAAQKYPTMPVEEICALPIHELIGNEAVLFLWATNPFLNEGIQVCEAWGFQYKTNLAWIKNTGPSMGWFVTSRHELLLIATKGDGMHPNEKPVSWFKADVRKHSQKPELVYEMIEKMYPGPYLELFARNKRDGWSSWGNQVE